GNGGTGTYGVDADAGRERLGEGSGGRPEQGLGQGVGEVIGRDAQYALVDDVDDVGSGAGGQLRGEIAGEEDRRLGVQRHVQVVEVLVQGVDAVGLVDRGVVDQQGKRADRLAGPGHQPHAVGAPGKVGLDDGGAAAVTFDGFGELLGLLA